MNNFPPSRPSNPSLEKCLCTQWMDGFEAWSEWHVHAPLSSSPKKILTTLESNSRTAQSCFPDFVLGGVCNSRAQISTFSPLVPYRMLLSQSLSHGRQWLPTAVTSSDVSATRNWQKKKNSLSRYYVQPSVLRCPFVCTENCVVGVRSCRCFKSSRNIAPHSLSRA